MSVLAKGFSAGGILRCTKKEFCSVVFFSLRHAAFFYNYSVHCCAHITLGRVAHTRQRCFRAIAAACLLEMRLYCIRRLGASRSIREKIACVKVAFLQSSPGVMAAALLRRTWFSSSFLWEKREPRRQKRSRESDSPSGALAQLQQVGAPLPVTSKRPRGASLLHGNPLLSVHDDEPPPPHS